METDNKNDARRSMPRFVAPEIRLSTHIPNKMPRTPPRRGITSPSPQVNRFKGLSEASSPARSPDPTAMHIDQSPSTAELIANILNSANPNRSTLSPARVSSAGPSKQSNSQLLSPSERHLNRKPSSGSQRHLLPIMRTGGKPPSPHKNARKQAEASVSTPPTRVLSGSEDAGRVVVKSEEETRELGLEVQAESSRKSPPPPQSQSQLLQPSAMDENSVYVTSQSPGHLTSQALEQAPSAEQHRSQTPPPSSALPVHGRIFRTGTLDLYPTLSQPGEETMQSEHTTSSQIANEGRFSNMHSEAGLSPEFGRPHAAADIYVSEEDMLHSSLDPSIPNFTQAPGGLDSQWPLQTQAPYSFDSQLDLDSQSQSQWLSHEPLSSRLGGNESEHV